MIYIFLMLSPCHCCSEFHNRLGVNGHKKERDHTTTFFEESKLITRPLFTECPCIGAAEKRAIIKTTLHEIVPVLPLSTTP
jgi:hypothetical protein